MRLKPFHFLNEPIRSRDRVRNFFDRLHQRLCQDRSRSFVWMRMQMINQCERAGSCGGSELHHSGNRPYDLVETLVECRIMRE